MYACAHTTCLFQDWAPCVPSPIHQHPVYRVLVYACLDVHLACDPFTPSPVLQVRMSVEGGCTRHRPGVWAVQHVRQHRQQPICAKLQLCKSTMQGHTIQETARRSLVSGSGCFRPMGLPRCGLVQRRSRHLPSASRCKALLENQFLCTFARLVRSTQQALPRRPNRLLLDRTRPPWRPPRRQSRCRAITTQLCAWHTCKSRGILLLCTARLHHGAGRLSQVANAAFPNGLHDHASPPPTHRHPHVHTPPLLPFPH